MQIVRRSSGETDFHDGDAELSKRVGNVNLLVGGHGGTRGLLTITEGGIENSDMIVLC